MRFRGDANPPELDSMNALPPQTSLQAKSRIAVVDDHGIVRFGYAQLINQEPDLEVCGMADNEVDGLALLCSEHPHLAIIDLSLQGGDGINLIKTTVREVPDTKILVISAHDENLYAHRVLAIGAAGYINKQEAPEKLIDGIRAVINDDYFFGEAVTRRLIRKCIGKPKPIRLVGIETLTNRELQVFEQIGKGQSTRQIADAMFLSIKTVERHKENIKQKLNLQHATQLTQHATQWVIERGY